MQHWCKKLQAQVKKFQSEHVKVKAACVKYRLRFVQMQKQCLGLRNKLQGKEKLMKKVYDILNSLVRPTPDQVKCLLKGKKKTCWDQQDICQAITIRAMSKKMLHIHEIKDENSLIIDSKKMGGKSIFHCRAGVLHEVLEIMPQT